MPMAVMGFIQRLNTGDNQDTPWLLPKRFSAVNDQIHHHLLHLSGIGINQGQMWGQIGFKPHVFRQAGLKQVQIVADNRVQV